jgi:hypothetical protein
LINGYDEVGVFIALELAFPEIKAQLYADLHHATFDN